MTRALGCALVLALAVSLPAARAGEAAGEKLLLGFEKDEIARIAEKLRKFEKIVHKEEGAEILFGEPLRDGGYNNVYEQPYRAGKDFVTQGEYALKHTIPIENTAGGNLGRPDPDTVRPWAVFSTYNGGKGLFDAFLPRDWSGYPTLRLDLRVERPESKLDTGIWVDIDDGTLDPPLKRAFAVPAGKWVTLELDLEKAVKERGLDLSRMCYFIIRLDPAQKAKPAASRREIEKAVFYVDNIRLAPREAKAAGEVLRDESPMKVEKPRTYAVDYDAIKDCQGRSQLAWKAADMELPKSAAAKPEPGPARLEAPAVIDLKPWQEAISKNVRLAGEVAAFDGRRMLVPFGGCPRAPWFPAHDRNVTFLLGTADGGKTWKGLDGGDKPTPFYVNHHTFSGAVALGGDMMVFGDFGCNGTGHSYPIDKGYCRRAVLSGEDKWWVSPYYFTDPHGHGCLGGQDSVRLASGRIWTAWASSSRNGSDMMAGDELCAKYSDDGGRTWQSWGQLGKVPRIPELKAGQFCIFPWGEGVGVFVRQGEDTAFSCFDGKAWSRPQAVKGRVVGPAVAFGCRAYLAGRNGVSSWDGKELKSELGVPNAQLSASGKTLFCFGPDPTGMKVLAWRKAADGAWKGPQELAAEDAPICNISTQKYAPADFAPVAYMCWESAEVAKNAGITGYWYDQKAQVVKPWIKLLKVPAE